MILFIASSEFDYAQDQLFSGLYQLLGSKKLFCYPWKPQFFIRRAKWRYPKNQGLINPQQNFFARIQEGLKTKLNPQQLAQCQVAIIASCKPDCISHYLKIAKHLSKDCKVIFIDGGDRPEVAGDLKRLNQTELIAQLFQTRDISYILKREKIIGKKYDSNVIAFPFSWNHSLFPHIAESNTLHKYQVTFWAVESDPVRTKALEMLEGSFDCSANGTHRGQKFRKYKRVGEFYLQELLASQVVLNFRGVGWDTLRYWEATALGCLLVSQRPQIEIPNNFENEKEIIFCKDDLSDLIEICEYYLKNPILAKRIGDAARAKSLQYHTNTARAEQLLKLLENY